MENQLNDLLLLNGNISEINSDSFVYKLVIKTENLQIIKSFYECNLVEQITDDQNQIIVIENLSAFENQSIFIEFITSEIKKIGFYLTINEFILDNRLEIPAEFYIKEISFSHLSDELIDNISKYKTITNLIEILTSKAKFISDEHIKTICLVQDNSFVEIPIETIVYEDYLETRNIELINQYIVDINSYKEKRTIFIKELIDFLITRKKDNRLKDLIINFEELYEKCNTSFDYYLSNFSFSKIKIELDNSVLEYSKNIRSIINESQSKLIAIPAAFILGVSQIDYSDPFIFKNILIVASAFLFSYIISIFINNQTNAIEIISDNLNNYKINYQRSKANQFEEERELISLSELISSSYIKIEVEIKKQEKRLEILQYCNWGISIALVISIIAISFSQAEWNCLT